MNKLRIIISAVLFLVTIVTLTGCEGCRNKDTDEPKEGSELKLGNSMDYGREAFTQKELLDLHERYIYELDYIVTYLECVDEWIFSMGITHDLTQVSVDYIGILNPDFMHNYVDRWGVEEDNEFERCLRAVLVEGELGSLRRFRGSGVTFGSKQALVYDYSEIDLKTAKKYFGTNNPDAIGQIDSHWFYYAHDPEFTTGNSHVDSTLGRLSKEEIKDLYYRRKFEFNYVARYLCANDKPSYNVIYYIVVLNNYEDVMMSEWTLTYWNGYIPYTDMGYEKDEEFERCLKVILVEEGMGYIYFSEGGYIDRYVRISFNGYVPIQYISKLYETEELGLVKSKDYFGRIEGNWYFEVQN